MSDVKLTRDNDLAVCVADDITLCACHGCASNELAWEMLQDWHGDEADRPTQHDMYRARDAIFDMLTQPWCIEDGCNQLAVPGAGLVCELHRGGP